MPPGGHCYTTPSGSERCTFATPQTQYGPVQFELSQPYNGCTVYVSTNGGSSFDIPATVKGP